jgi:hypothetical protein
MPQAPLISTLLLVLALAASAQDAQPPAPSPPTPPAPTDAAPTDSAPATSIRVTGRPATVNNQAITSDDVLLQVRLLGLENQRLDPGVRDHIARRAVAEEMLLAGEARRLEVEMPDRDVDAWWERRSGEAPDWDKQAEATGLTVARQRELARRAAMADLYVMHKCGLRGDQAHKVPPDPVLERVVTITPSQLREAFTQNHELFDRPEGITCHLYVAGDASARDVTASALDAGTTPLVAPLTRTIALPDTERIFGKDVAAWLATAQPGQHRILDEQTLVAVGERVPPKPATFAESQEALHNALLDQLLKQARAHLVDALRGQATYWPGDLFSPPAKETPKPAAVPAEPTPPSSP